MNVVEREKLNRKLNPNKRNELIRKESCFDIRGSSVLMSIRPSISNYNGARKISNPPRYQFSGGGGEPPAKTRRNSTMGPPLEPPRTSKKRVFVNSTSSGVQDTSYSGRVLANDSAATDPAQGLCTPANRPTALRYISSSSRGGQSGNRSIRSTSASVVEASVVLAISEGRGAARGEIGIAAVDLRHPHLVLCQFSDSLLYTHTLTKINYFNPIEIIFPNTFCEGVHTNQLYQLIKDQFPSVHLTSVQRRHFRAELGREQIRSLCAPQYSAVCLQVLQKFYALTAAAAVLKYVEYIQCIVFARESLKIEYHSSENTMIIDVGTAIQLELVQPLVTSAGPSCSLLGVLGPTYTAGGIRALRAGILQPSCNKEVIEARLDVVQDLIENDNGLMTSLQDVIKKLSEVDKILLLCMEPTGQSMEKVGEAQINQTILLKTTMDVVPRLVEALAVAECGRLRKMKMDFEDPNYKQIKDRIQTVIQEDAHLERGAMGSIQRCFAVKPGINGFLDVARRAYSELIEDIQKMVEQLSETYDLTLRLNQTVLKGFHIVLPIAPKNRRNFKAEDLPDIFIQVQVCGTCVTMTTEELVALDHQAKESLNEIQKMSNIVISSLLKELRPFMPSLYKLCENVAELDILLALAHASTVGSYIRPEFGDYLDVKNSVHPLLDYNSQTMPVQNDIYASPEYNFTIITGPNMGGKSIYIKQVAIMQIMAQLGCFLPATNAVLRLCDRVFSRIGFNDSVELNASTYVFEMKEIQHILQGLTNTSLVVIDELCRGTCTEEGTSMSWTICEELMRSDAFTFFTTHFLYLTRLQDLYFNVVNLYTVVTEEEISDSQGTQTSLRRLVYQHKIEPGVTKIERYGLALASKTNLPEVTVQLAEELAELIIKRKKPQDIHIPEKRDEKMLYDLNAAIRKETRKNGNSEETVKQILRKFKEENPELVARLRVEQNNSGNDKSLNSSDMNIRNETPKNTAPKDSSLETNEIQNHCHKIVVSTSDLQNETSSSFKNTPLAKFVNHDGENNHKNKPKIFVYSTSDLENDTDHTNQREKNLVPKPPRVVYSSTDLENEYSAKENFNLSLVRSSNELLNTMINFTENESVIEESNNNNTSSSQNNLNNSTPGRLSNNEVNDFTEKSRSGFSFKRSSTSSNSVRPNNGDQGCDNISMSQRSVDRSPSITSTPKLSKINYRPHKERSIQRHKEYVDDECVIIINSDHDITEIEESDTADALTQVLETESEETVHLEQSDDDVDLSLDEDLMKETVDAINASLVESIILTPPAEFRD